LKEKNMNYDRFSLPTEPTDQLPALHRWIGGEPPKAILVIAHGMGEHALRYARFAEALVNEGFVVYANDHRGHGATVRHENQLGEYGEAGWNGLVSDQKAVIDKAKEDFPGLPLAIMGHSMGSMVVQHLLTEASDLVDAASLSGTTAVDIMAAAVSDPDVDVFETMNAAFEPTRTQSDWLSRDESEVDKYVADPLCGFTVSDASTAGLAEAGIAFSTPEAIAKVRKDLPLYIFSVDKDPVGLNGELVALVAQRYRDAGLEHVELRLYADARHEVLNETNRDEITADFVKWALASLKLE
jgi:alpha-beta hydrolase superfamily lysophospholipase